MIKKPTFDLRLGPIFIDSEAGLGQNRFFLRLPSSAKALWSALDLLLVAQSIHTP